MTIEEVVRITVPHAKSGVVQHALRTAPRGNQAHVANHPSAAEGDGREGRFRPPHHDHQPAAAPHRRRARAADRSAAHAGRHQESLLLCSPTRRSIVSRRTTSSTSRSASRPRPLPRQRLHAAGRGGRRLPHRSRSRSAPSRSSACRRRDRAEQAAARPRAGHRPHRLGQVDHARVDDRQDQHRAARAHHHDRGSDRVPAPAQELPGQPARGRRGHASASSTRSSTSFARTRTSCWSARCATSRRSRPR